MSRRIATAQGIAALTLPDGGADADGMSGNKAFDWLLTLPRGKPCGLVIEARDTAIRAVESGERPYDTTMAAALQLIRLGARGHRGSCDAVREVNRVYAKHYGDAEQGVSPLQYAVRKLAGTPVAPPCRCSASPPADPAATSGMWLTGSQIGDYAASDVRSLWGPRDAPLWAPGQSVMIVGPPGVGKSTLAQLIVAGRLGLRAEVLGYPVVSDGGRVLYVAADRPKQIARGILRAVPDGSSRLVVWRGPLPQTLAVESFRTWLTDQAVRIDATTVVIDSVKDVLPNSSDEVSAGAYNLARQHAVANGVEWIELHHSRKASSDNRAPRRLDDVYGSRWLTAGAGSVISLWGQSGSNELTLTQVKPIEGTHPPLALTLDGTRGDFHTPPGADEPIDGALLFAGDDGLTPTEAARVVHGEHCTDLDVDRYRKRLRRMAERGALRTEKDGRTTRYFLA